MIVKLKTITKKGICKNGCGKGIMVGNYQLTISTRRYCFACGYSELNKTIAQMTRAKKELGSKYHKELILRRLE